jgi:hypothetical protein
VKKALWILALVLLSASVFAQTPPAITILSPDAGAIVQRNSTVGIAMSVASDFTLYVVEIAVKNSDDQNVWICDYGWYPGPGPFYCAWPVPPKPRQSYEIYFYANSIDSANNVVYSTRITRDVASGK